MWTPADRALVGGFGSGQALTDDQFRLLEPLIPPAKSGGRPRSTDIRRVLDGLFYLVRTSDGGAREIPARDVVNGCGGWESASVDARAAA